MKIFIKSYIWSTYGLKTWILGMLRGAIFKRLRCGAGGGFKNTVDVKRVKTNNDEVLKRVGEKRTLIGKEK